MLVKLLKSKLHRARLPEAKLHYPGSIAIDSALMEAVNILPYESVLVADLNNGNRLETLCCAGGGKFRTDYDSWSGSKLIKAET